LIKVAMMMKDDLEPPPNLSPRSRDLWRCLVPRRARSTERRLALEAALLQLDIADALRASILREGIVLRSTRSRLARANPTLRAEGAARARFVRMWLAIGFHWDPTTDGRVNDNDLEALRVDE
jgi:hypothetical protein